MKLNKSGIFAVIALGGLMALGQVARAEDTPDKPAPKTDAGTDAPAGRPNMRQQMEKIFTAVKATDEQKEKLKPIFKERGEKMRALRDDTALSQEDRMAKRKEIVKAADEKIKGVLSADQYEEFQKFQKEQQKQGRRRQQPPADAAPKN